MGATLFPLSQRFATLTPQVLRGLPSSSQPPSSPLQAYYWPTGSLPVGYPGACTGPEAGFRGSVARRSRRRRQRQTAPLPAARSRLATVPPPQHHRSNTVTPLVPSPALGTLRVVRVPVAKAVRAIILKIRWVNALDYG